MFIHLHWHSHYSLLDGLWTPKEIVWKAKELWMHSIAITDHGVWYGMVEFYEVAQKEWIKPILWVEAYITYNMQEKNKNSQTFHLVLLAKNFKWYKNIMKLISIAHIDWFYRKARIDFDLLEKYREGIIWLSACAGGEIARMITENEPTAKIEERIAFYKKLFDGDFFLEIQPREYDLYDFQKKINDTVLELGKSTNTKVVVTMDYHYIDKTDAEAHDVLICMQTGKKFYDKDRMRYKWDFHISSEEEMREKLENMNISSKDIDEVISNTELVASKCDIDLGLHKLLFPKYKIPEKYEKLYKKLPK